MFQNSWGPMVIPKLSRCAMIMLDEGNNHDAFRLAERCSRFLRTQVVKNDQVVWNIVVAPLVHDHLREHPLEQSAAICRLLFALQPVYDCLDGRTGLKRQAGFFQHFHSKGPETIKNLKYTDSEQLMKLVFGALECMRRDWNHLYGVASHFTVETLWDPLVILG